MDGPAGREFQVIAIAGSAGGIEALIEIVSKLSMGNLPAIVVAQHLSRRRVSQLVAVLRLKTELHVKWAWHGERLMANTIYIAPPNREVVLSSRSRLKVSPAAPNSRWTPNADRLFESVATLHGENAIGVVLSGFLHDGSAGVLAMKRCRSTILIQRPDTALAAEMPESAMKTPGLHYVIPIRRIAMAIAAIVNVPGVVDVLNHKDLAIRYWLQCRDNCLTAS